MASIHEMPFVRLVIPLGIGIAIADIYQLPLKYCALPFAITLTTLFLVYTYSRSYKTIQSCNYIILLLFFFGGAASIRFADNFLTHTKIPSFKKYNFEGYVDNLKKSDSINACTFIVNKYFDRDSTYTKDLKIALRISNYSQELRNGDHLIVNGELRPIYSNKNPHTFDYKNYLRHNQVFHQLYANPENIVTHIESEGIYFLPTRLNNRAQVILKKYLSPESAGVAIGMITGSKNDIPSELLDTYSRVGVMHLLAVSGLHVGIISEFIFLLLGQKKKKRNKIIAVVITISMVWLFVLFTGSSASTVRAGIMFSLLYLSRIENKFYSTYNAIAASAFGLLIYNPHNLFDIGFQLSYLAVTSIIFFYPIIYNLLDAKRMWPPIRFAWNLAVLSISANILILPLTIYYFNLIPLSFPITNIVAVPSAGVIVIGGFIMLALDTIAPIITTQYAMIYEFWIFCTNKFLFFMEGIPHLIIEDIQFNSTQLIVVFFSLMLMMLLFGSQKLGYLKYSLVTILVLLVYTNIDSIKTSNDSKFMVYDIYGKTVIDYSVRNTTYFYSNDSISQKSIDFNIKPNRIANKSSEVIDITGIENFKNQDITRNKSILIFENKLFFIPQTKTELQNIPPETDYIIINHNHYLTDLNLNPKTIVILNNDKFLNTWRLNIPEENLIRIGKDGPYSVNLSDV